MAVDSDETNQSSNVSPPPITNPQEEIEEQIEEQEKQNRVVMAVADFLLRNIKYISLIILVAQNAALVLTMRYSRIVTGGKMYLASTAVVLTELMKFVISVAMIFYNLNCDVQKTGQLIYVEIIEKGSGTLKVSIPSVLYTIQNNLLYVAISHLNAATFQVNENMSFVTEYPFSIHR